MTLAFWGKFVGTITPGKMANCLFSTGEKLQIVWKRPFNPSEKERERETDGRTDRQIATIATLKSLLADIFPPWYRDNR